MPSYCDFNTQLCHINNQVVNIINYDKLQKPICYCRNNHELIYISKSKDGKREHFKHKDNEYYGMSFWHEEFQSYFENTEIWGEKNNNIQSKTRRADVMLNNDTIIEFQHSVISKEEVDSRRVDWKTHNKEIIWVINGNIGVEIYNISDSRCIFYFIDDWKYNSFIEYDEIYIEKENVVYCIKPKMVKNKYYETNEKIYKIEFIKNLKNNIKPLISFNKIDITQSKIYIKQQGAGNGKTYGIVKLLTDDEFEFYDVFIYLTKQHSAKYIILKEINEQKMRGLLSDISFEEYQCEEGGSKIYDTQNKKYIINITNKITNKKKKIIIGTFDSYIYSVKPNNIMFKSNSNADKFIEMAQSIINVEVNKSIISYGGENIKLNKKLLLIGDEMQDMNYIYMVSILRLIRDNYIDLYAVGDKLQSLSLEDNSFTHLNLELPNTIKKIEFEKINKCRRFDNNFLIKFVNYMIDFEKHGVPKIEDNITGIYNKDSLCIFEGHNIFTLEKDEKKIKDEVNVFMQYYKKEVIENNRNPNDIMIISPIVSNNIMCEAIKTHIIEFWKKIKGDDVIDDMCCVLHKSENGCSINLEESKNATRIVSIHSSKGDQRKVVFVMGLTEQILNIFDEKTGGLIFDSLLHVSVTRMIEKLYIKYENKNDIIGKKILKFAEENDININSCGNDHIDPTISITLSIEKSHHYNLYEKIYNIFKDDIIKLHEKYKISKGDQNDEIIDIQHHAVRYHTMFILTIITISIISKNDDDINENKIGVINSLKNIINYNILEFDKNDYYKLFKNNCDKKFLQHDTNGNVLHNKLNCLPILVYKHSKNYNRYCNKIKTNIYNIKQKLKNILYNNEKLNVLSYIECLTLCHFFIIVNNKTKLSFPINDLYDITNIIDTNANDNINTIIKSHYKKINIIHNIIDIIINKYKLTNYITYSKFELETCCGSNTFIIKTNFNLIGYNDDETLIMYIKPQLNDINYNITIAECIIDLFMIKYCAIGNDNRKTIIKNNKLISCIITLDNNQIPYIIDWENEFKNEFYKKNKNYVIHCIKEFIIYRCRCNHDKIYDFFIYYYNDSINVKSMIKDSVIISNIIEIYINSNNFDSNPKYILNAFNDIKNNIIKKKNNIKYYIDYDVFNECLIEHLNIDIEEFIECLSMNM